MDVNSRQVDGDHYRSEYQHWDFAADCDLGYFESACTKYVTRWRSKNGVVDLEKAIHYTKKLIALVKDGRVTRRPSGTPALVHTFAKANGLDEREELIVLLMSIWKATKDLKNAIRSIELLIKGGPHEPDQRNVRS